MFNWQEKCDVFLLEPRFAIDPSNLASENYVIEHAEVQKQPLAFSSISFGNTL